MKIGHWTTANDKGKPMNPLDLFNGQVPFKRIYLQPPTSQRVVPKGMKNLDKFLSSNKETKDRKNKQNPREGKQKG